jgi:hypothetical protein
MPLKFRIVWATLGLDAPTMQRLWDALSRTGHPLGRRLAWRFVKEDSRKTRGIAERLAAVLTAHPLTAWHELLEHLVETERLTRAEANAVLECWLPLVDAQGQWH